MRHLTLPLCAALAFGSIQGALAQEPPARTIIVTGLGEASAEPDMATVSIGVETEGKTAAEALQANSASMRSTLERLKRNGIADKDMQTQNLSVNPRYNYGENRTSPEIIGYVATNTLSVKLRDLDKAGAVIDAAVSTGANNLGGVSFGFADDRPLMNEARKAAVKDAREKAALYAEAAGVSLGPIIQLQDGYSVTPPPQPYMAARAMTADSKSTPVATGESTVTANVTLVYEIR